MSVATTPHPDLQTLAWHLDSFGPAGVEESLRAVAGRARAGGIASVLIEVLTDATAPEVCRLRAFGRIATLLDGCRGRDGGPVLLTAA